MVMLQAFFIYRNSVALYMRRFHHRSVPRWTLRKIAIYVRYTVYYKRPEVHGWSDIEDHIDIWILATHHYNRTFLFKFCFLPGLDWKPSASYETVGVDMETDARGPATLSLRRAISQRGRLEGWQMAMVMEMVAAAKNGVAGNARRSRGIFYGRDHDAA
jgi:hypothetical protein